RCNNKQYNVVKIVTLIKHFVQNYNTINQRNREQFITNFNLKYCKLYNPNDDTTQTINTTIKNISHPICNKILTQDSFYMHNGLCENCYKHQIRIRLIQQEYL